MKKLTRKQAEAALKRKFGKVTHGGLGNVYLCTHMPMPLRHEFWAYWRDINTKKILAIPRYFDKFYDYEEDTFLRLLTAHIFIRDTYKD